MNQALIDIGSDAFVDDDVDAVVPARDRRSSTFDGASKRVFLQCPARRARADRASANVAAAAIVAVVTACVDNRQKYFC
jgi:hypothetical protein